METDDSRSRDPRLRAADTSSEGDVESDENDMDGEDEGEEDEEEDEVSDGEYSSESEDVSPMRGRFKFAHKAPLASPSNRMALRDDSQSADEGLATYIGATNADGKPMMMYSESSDGVPYDDHFVARRAISREAYTSSSAASSMFSTDTDEMVRVPDESLQLHEDENMDDPPPDTVEPPPGRPSVPTSPMLIGNQPISSPLISTAAAPDHSKPSDVDLKMILDSVPDDDPFLAELLKVTSANALEDSVPMSLPSSRRTSVNLNVPTVTVREASPSPSRSPADGISPAASSPIASPAASPARSPNRSLDGVPPGQSPQSGIKTKRGSIIHSFPNAFQRRANKTSVDLTSAAAAGATTTPEANVITPFTPILDVPPDLEPHPSAATLTRVERAKAHLEAKYAQIEEILRLASDGATMLGSGATAGKPRPLRYNPVAVVRWRRE
ncbi:hypothetical protein HK101_009986, partial [Irineochytrium annulatum]